MKYKYDPTQKIALPVVVLNGSKSDSRSESKHQVVDMIFSCHYLATKNIRPWMDGDKVSSNRCVLFNSLDKSDNDYILVAKSMDDTMKMLSDYGIIEVID